MKGRKMICCTLIAALLGILAWPVRRWVGHSASPLAWRPHAAQTAVPPERFSIAARARSIGFAVEGVRYLFRHEHNAWVHLGAAALVATSGLLLEVSANDWRWLILSIALVWAAEAGNTAVEQLCDLVHPGRHAPVTSQGRPFGVAVQLADFRTLLGPKDSSLARPPTRCRC